MKRLILIVLIVLAGCHYPPVDPTPTMPPIGMTGIPSAIAPTMPPP